MLAGGQSLIPVLRLRLAYPSTVVDVGRVAEMRGVRDDGDAIVIGAMTTHDDVMHDAAGAAARAAHRAGDRDGRRPAGPPPRHVRRRAGARRPGRRPRRGGARARTASSWRTARTASGASPAADFFLDYLTTALAPGRDADRDPGAEARRRAGPRTTRSSTGSRRPGRSSAVAAVVRRDERLDRRGPDRADQHGLDAAARERGRVGAGRRRRLGRRDRRGRRARGRGHQRPQRPVGQGRLP